jgi:peptidoglycan/xylan/chitin deacetylase (PgdA/CDA1 family)
LLKATALVHGTAALALAALPLWPQLWLWAVAALVLNHAVLAAASLWPRSQALGANLTRLPATAAARGEVALTIDDGPNPSITPILLDLLDVADVRATFFCIADKAEAHPQLLAEIVRRGHSVQNHSQSHGYRFSLLGPRGFEREIARSQAVFTRLLGHAPILFRAPAGLRNPFLGPVLHRHGLGLVSWTRRGFDTRERSPGKVLRRLTRSLSAGDILLLHDGAVAMADSGRPVSLLVLPALLRTIRDAGLNAVTLPQALAGTGRPR